MSPPGGRCPCLPRVCPLCVDKLTAGEGESVELGDDEQLAAVLLEGQVTEPLEELGHLLGAPVQTQGHQRQRLHPPCCPTPAPHLLPHTCPTPAPSTLT